MIPLYTKEQLSKAKYNDKLPCECYQCHSIFYQTKHSIQDALNPNNKRQGKFCSKQCSSNSQKTKQLINCKYCNVEFNKLLSEIKRNKNHFCSQSCCASYSNKHKTTGNRRSKLEIWLEQQLTILYPNIEFHFNRKNTIGSELDIYIPSLNLAFELNGIFHYEPIYGINKLDQIKDNDISKSKACHDAKIDLCIINVSGQKYFKTSTSQKYLDIINNIISNNAAESISVEESPI